MKRCVVSEAGSVSEYLGLWPRLSGFCIYIMKDKYPGNAGI